MSVLTEYGQQYRHELCDNVIPFWEKFCVDKEYGGYFTSLDRDGTLYDTEKYMWMQWRIVWMFCELYQKLERNENWLKIAEEGYRFLTEHGKDEQGRYYFALARDGRPSVAPYSVFSDCFAVMGAAAYHKATGDDGARREALRAFDSYLAREALPKGEWTKELAGRKPMKSLGFYMMKANLALVLEECLGDSSSRAVMMQAVRTILDDFWSPAHETLLENIGLDNRPDISSTSGRHLNPGHALEAMWFVMNVAVETGERDLVERAADIILAELKLGWDSEYGGIYYFMDLLGKPHLELQWNMKLWWVHCEALIALAMAYKLTGRDDFRQWFLLVHQWTWSHYPDPEYGEWFGYLDRFGNVTHTLKGGKWKSFFHLPRMLLICGDIMTD